MKKRCNYQKWKIKSNRNLLYSTNLKLFNFLIFWLEIIIIICSYVLKWMDKEQFERISEKNFDKKIFPWLLPIDLSQFSSECDVLPLFMVSRQKRCCICDDRYKRHTHKNIRSKNKHLYTYTYICCKTYICIYSVDGDLVAHTLQSCLDCCSFPCRCFYMKIFKFKKQFYWNGNRIDRNIFSHFLKYGRFYFIIRPYSYWFVVLDFLQNENTRWKH